MHVSATLGGALRRARGFARYAVSVQYHGGSFLGFTYQGSAVEDSIVSASPRKKNGKRKQIDLRGHRSVEGRLREALDDLFGEEQWENIQASSRTDRGVHALKNTFHVDILTIDSNRKEDGNSNDDGDDRSHDKRGNETTERKLRDGLNFYLSRQTQKSGHASSYEDAKKKKNPMMNELRILNAVKSPEYLDNPYARTRVGRARGQPHWVDWNARFSATQRTYVYRLLCYYPRESDGTSSSDDDGVSSGQHLLNYGIPFEWDRAWCLPQSPKNPLDLRAMREAAKHFVGTHDFSSFRGRSCQRNSPIVAMKSVRIDSNNSGASGGGADCYNAIDDKGEDPSRGSPQQQQQQLVTISFVANSFLYRQVRNMVGCLVEVGKHGGRLEPNDVADLLAVDTSDRQQECDEKTSTKTKTFHLPPGFKERPYSTAPPQGLFLVDVQHGDFRF